MDTDIFFEHFKATGGYETPAKPNRLTIDRMLGWSDTWYYIRLLGIVLYGVRLAVSGRYTADTWKAQSMSTWKLVEGCGGRIALSGVERIIDSQAAPRVYVANHMSLLETFLLPGVLVPFGGVVAMVIKDDLLRVPLFGRIMRAVKPISVGRKNPRADFKKVMTEGVEALEQGRSIVIFPQSTRTTEFDPAMFNTMGTRLADRAGVLVQPIAVKTDFMGIGRVVKDCGPISRDKTVHVEVGMPMPVNGNVREVQQEIIQFIGSRLLAWGGEVKSARA